MIQVGVTYREQLAVFHAPPDLALDLRRTRQPGGRVDGHVARGAGHQSVEPARLLRRLEQRADDFVRPRAEPLLHAVRRVPARQDRERDDGRIGVALEAGAPPPPPGAARPGPEPPPPRATGDPPVPFCAGAGPA